MQIARLFSIVPFGLLVVVSAGCVTIYQPMAGLQRPVAVNPNAENLPGLHILINCVPGDFLDRTGAALLCRKTKALFTNQGASVRTNTDLGSEVDEGKEDSGG
jgi:hypothetical protein